MNAVAEDRLVADVARDLVMQVAPDEAPLFELTSEVYFQTPERARPGRPGKEEELGFGLEAFVGALTPIALAVATEVVTYLVNEVTKALKAESTAAINDATKSLFKRLRPAAEGGRPAGTGEPRAPTLTAAQLAEVRRLALEKARLLNLPEARATLLADALVGGLVAPA